MKKTKYTFALFVIMAVIALSAANGICSRDNDKKERSSDICLKSKLITTYTLNEHLNPFKLDVDVNNGVATLSGSVDSDVEKDLAVEIAKGIDGIKDVKDIQSHFLNGPIKT